MKDSSVKTGWLLPNTHCCSSPWLSASDPPPPLSLPNLPPKPPPPSTTVQQLDPRGDLLASMPTHSTPWCQNREHSGIAQTVLSKANRQKLSKPHSSAVRSPPACRPTGMCTRSKAVEMPNAVFACEFVLVIPIHRHLTVYQCIITLRTAQHAIAVQRWSEASFSTTNR